MKYWPLILLFILACKNGGRERKESISKDSFPAKTVDDSAKQIPIEETCGSYPKYSSLDNAEMKRIQAELVNTAELTSFKFFFRNKTKWDAHKPLAVKLGLPDSTVIIETTKIKV